MVVCVVVVSIVIMVVCAVVAVITVVRVVMMVRVVVAVVFTVVGNVPAMFVVRYRYRSLSFKGMISSTILPQGILFSSYDVGKNHFSF